MSEMKVEGTLTEFTEPKVLKEGTTKKGKPYTFYGVNLEVDGKTFGMTSFSSSELEDILAELEVGQEISFVAEENKGYWNVKNLEELQSNGKPKPKTPEKKLVKPKEHDKEKPLGVPGVNAKEVLDGAKAVYKEISDRPLAERKQLIELFSVMLQEKKADARTEAIQGFKRENMRNFRRNK